MGPLLCSSMCPLLPLLSPPPIGSHVRIFVLFTVSIDASVATGTCPSIYGSCIHLTCTATPLSPVLSPPRLNPPPPTSRRPPTPCSFRAPPTARARPMLHRRAFPLSRNVVTASPHPPPPSHVPHVRVDAERRRGQHSSWLKPSAWHGHGSGVRRRRKPRGASREGGCFDLPCHGAPGAGVALGRPAPAHPNHQKNVKNRINITPCPLWVVY